VSASGVGKTNGKCGKRCRSRGSCCKFSSYNRIVFRPSAVFLCAFAVLASCRNDMRDKAKVQEAIVTRLQKSSGLDLKSLDITTTSVRFDKNLAFATVAFHPKDDPRVDHGMQMKYTLEDRDGKWVVVRVGDSQGHGFGSGGSTAAGSTLPPGHPSVDGGVPGNPHEPSATPMPNGQPR
jgi:hypothetical protein